jgi:LysM repeat protein
MHVRFIYMKEQKYHIDVTPEEDQLFRDKAKKPTNPSTFGQVFWIVVGVHMIVIGALVTTTFAAPVKSKQDNLPPETNKPVEQKPNPSPTPLIASSPTPTPAPITSSRKPVIESSTKLTKTYTIKQGDTINNISKRYKLNAERLLKLNNIKDPNKIVVGQTLKFL